MGRVPSETVLLGALGSRTLQLAGRRTLGAHPYLTTPDHTRYAREILGANPFLAPEHKVVLIEDHSESAPLAGPRSNTYTLGCATTPTTCCDTGSKKTTSRAQAAIP